jgi:very-short-patch-repair endonuclease
MRPASRSDPEALVRRSAEAHHGIFTREIVRHAGMHGSTFKRRKARGIYVERLPGVFAVAGIPQSWYQDCAAALAWSGPESALSHQTAAALRGLEAFVRYRPIHLSTMDMKHPPREWLVVHRVDDALLGETEMLGPLRVTSRRRMLLELAGILDRRFESALDQCVRDGERLEHLWKIVVNPKMWGRRGVAIMREALEERAPEGAPTHSRAERLLRQIVRDARLPRPVGQFAIVLSWGEAHLDFAYPRKRLGIECDGYGSHMSRLAFERDRERDLELGRLGWLILRFTWYKLRYEPEFVAATIAHHLETRPDFSV